MLAQAIHSQGNQVAGKQFGQRRRNGFQQRTCAYKIEIFIDSITSTGQDFALARDALRIESGRLRQLQPTLDAAVFGPGVAVVIRDPLAPDATKLRIVAARQDNRILDRDDALVVVAIEGPGLQLSAAQFAIMHKQVKRMPVVIALLADLPQGGAKLVHRVQRPVLRVHNVKWHPSSASSHPESRTARYSAPASLSMGFVLLM